MLLISPPARLLTSRHVLDLIAHTLDVHDASLQNLQHPVQVSRSILVSAASFSELF